MSDQKDGARMGNAQPMYQAEIGCQGYPAVGDTEQGLRDPLTTLSLPDINLCVLDPRASTFYTPHPMTPDAGFVMGSPSPFERPTSAPGSSWYDTASEADGPMSHRFSNMPGTPYNLSETSSLSGDGFTGSECQFPFGNAGSESSYGDHASSDHHLDGYPYGEVPFRPGELGGLNHEYFDLFDLDI